MGRLWLALALLIALAAPAFAKRDPACPCEAARVVPAANAVDVPTNALFWHLPSDTPGRLIKPYELAPHSSFVVEGIPFTTGSGLDTEPPIKPAVSSASIALMDNDGLAYQISRLHVVAATSSDTDVVHLRFVGTWGTIDRYTTPDNLSVCGPPIDLMPGHVHLEITAIDAAGNESEPDVIELDTTTDPHPVQSCTRHAIMDDTIGWRRDEEKNRDVVIALVVLLLVGGTVLAYGQAHVHRRAQTEPSAFALLAVEQLARGVRARALATIMVLGAATGIALHEGAHVYADVVVPLAVVFGIRAIRRYIDAGRVLRLHGFDGATAIVQHDEIAVVVGRQRAKLHASPRLVERARHHALPKATL